MEERASIATAGSTQADPREIREEAARCLPLAPGRWALGCLLIFYLACTAPLRSLCGDGLRTIVLECLWNAARIACLCAMLDAWLRLRAEPCRLKWARPSALPLLQWLFAGLVVALLPFTISDRRIMPRQPHNVPAWPHHAFAVLGAAASLLGLSPPSWPLLLDVSRASRAPRDPLFAFRFELLVGFCAALSALYNTLAVGGNAHSNFINAASDLAYHACWAFIRPAYFLQFFVYHRRRPDCPTHRALCFAGMLHFFLLAPAVQGSTYITVHLIEVSTSCFVPIGLCNYHLPNMAGQQLLRLHRPL